MNDSFDLFEKLFDEINEIETVEDMMNVLRRMIELVDMDSSYARTSSDVLRGTLKTVDEWSGGHFEIDPMGPHEPDPQRMRLLARVLHSAIVLHNSGLN